MTSGISPWDIRLFPPSFSPWNGTGSGKEIAVLMSGGVDSSVTALLLKESGWKVLGITMKIPMAKSRNRNRPCCGADAALVCHELNIPHYYLDVEKAFRRHVIEPFQRSYAEGRTPNPCVDCNTFLKFGIAWEFLEKTFRVSRLATGHYARVVHSEALTHLARAVDKTKDQSYFLYGIARARLRHFVLPLAELSKHTVRSLAAKAGLPVADRDESMELCFADESDYRRALTGNGAVSTGPILDTAGNVMGRHEGIRNYTLGQRRGLRIAAGEPLYVTRISARDNSITVGTRDEAGRREVRAEDTNVLAPERFRPGAQLYGKIRSYGEPSRCSLKDVHNGSMTVEFDTPQFAPCPGQRLVLYDESGLVVAGGTIAS